jgi:pilus assembly protein Flp/PilA
MVQARFVRVLSSDKARYSLIQELLKPGTSAGGKNMIQNFLRDETGLELSEYAVAAALVAIAVVLAFSALGTAIGSKLNDLAIKVNS